MRTGRSLTVCWSLLPGGGCLLGGVVWGGGLLRGGVCSWGSGLGGCLLLGGGVWSGGVCSWGGISQHALKQTPPVDRHTPVKILPWPNFVAAGNKFICQDKEKKIKLKQNARSVNIPKFV